MLLVEEDTRLGRLDYASHVSESHSNTIDSIGTRRRSFALDSLKRYLRTAGLNKQYMPLGRLFKNRHLQHH